MLGDSNCHLFFRKPKIITMPLLVGISTVIRSRLIVRMGHEYLNFNSRVSVSQSVVIYDFVV
jgi:hypothetical protein